MNSKTERNPTRKLNWVEQARVNKKAWDLQMLAEAVVAGDKTVQDLDDFLYKEFGGGTKGDEELNAKIEQIYGDG